MNLIELKSLTRGTLTHLLDEASRYLDDDGRVHTPISERTRLDGKAVALLFFEPSTRTRVSFELAAKRLGAMTVALDEHRSSLKKGETMLDTIRNLEAMGCDAFVVRHARLDVPYVLAEHMETPLINAGNGSGEHPTQGLLDAMTLRRAIGDPGGAELEGKTVVILGDIVHSRVARSDVYALTALGARVLVTGPPMLLPEEGAEGWGPLTRVESKEEALASADAVIVLRIQRERMRDMVFHADEYIDRWRLDSETVASVMKPGAPILHPGPVIRGVELDGDVADGPRSLIMAQVRCGVAVRQAVLRHTMGL